MSPACLYAFSPSFPHWSLVTVKASPCFEMDKLVHVKVNNGVQKQSSFAMRKHVRSNFSEACKNISLHVEDQHSVLLPLAFTQLLAVG